MRNGRSLCRSLAHHRVWSVFLLSHPHPWTWKDGMYKARDYLTLTSWDNHCSWPITDIHLLLWIHSHYLKLSLIECPCNMCPESSFRVFFCKSSSQKYCTGEFFCCRWACFLWTLLNCDPGDFKTNMSFVHSSIIIVLFIYRFLPS
jgi:hypothetical protein